jgi:hypothetical protein
MAVFEVSDNYASEELQSKRRRLILYGVGEPTPEVAAVIAEAPDTLEAVWRPAPYTCAELCAETERIMERFPQILEGGPQDAGAGLEFSTLDRELVDAEDPQGVLAGHDRVRPSCGVLKPHKSRRERALCHELIGQGVAREAHLSRWLRMATK